MYYYRVRGGTCEGLETAAGRVEPMIQVPTLALDDAEFGRLMPGTC